MNVALFPDVTVNGVKIPSAEIAAEAQNHEAPKGKPGLAWRKAARALIVRELLLQEAGRLSLTPAPELLSEGKRETDDEALIREVLDRCAEYSQPSETEVRAHWDQNPERYRALPLWEVSHILCAAEPGDEAALAQAKTRATAILNEIGKDPKTFARAAREHSDCGSKSSNGALGQLSPGDTVPEFEAALRIMSDGEISRHPVRTRFGYHIIRLDAVAVGEVLPFEAVAPKIKIALEKSRWANAVHRLTNDLVENAAIDGIEIATI